MKKIILAFTLLSSFSAFAVSLSDIAGKYEVTSDFAPVTNIIEIDKDGNIVLVETSPYGEFTCSGTAVIADDILTSEVTCENGVSFNQRVDLSSVNQYDAFTAVVYSSLYDQELPMNFRKL